MRVIEEGAVVGPFGFSQPHVQFSEKMKVKKVPANGIRGFISDFIRFIFEIRSYAWVSHFQI